MTPCICDWPTVAEPPTISQAVLDLHRAIHDVVRSLIWPFRELMDRKLSASQLPVLELYRITRSTK